MNNMNLDNEMLNNLKSMMGEKQVNEALSQISPEMIKNFSNMINNNNSQNSTANSEENELNNIDIETVMKIKSVIDKMNTKQNDPRSNLLNSLKPYMRESRRENIDKYANILKMANLAELFNTESEQNANGQNRVIQDEDVFNEKKENNTYD